VLCCVGCISHSSQVEFSVSLTHGRLPAFSVSLSDDRAHAPAFTCLALKQAIFECTGLALGDQQLVINGQISLSDHDSLHAFRLLHHDRSLCPTTPPCLLHINRVRLVPVIPRLRGRMTPAVQASVAASLQPYVRSVFPADGTRDVSTHVLVQLQFRDISRGAGAAEEGAITLQEQGTCELHSRVALQCFSRPPREVCGEQLRRWSSATDMEAALGPREASRRGFTPGSGRDTDTDRRDQKLFLLEVSAQEGRQDLLRRRYEFSPWCGRNGGYRGGDGCSWRRYTSSSGGGQPLQGRVEVCAREGSVLFRPAAPLKPGTTYAVLVANGMPIESHLRPKAASSAHATVTDPMTSSSSSVVGGTVLDSDTTAMYSSTQDDLLFFFSTEAARERGTEEGEVVVGEEGGHGESGLCYGLGSGAGEPPLCRLS
jgi:hypothetical protein